MTQNITKSHVVVYLCDFDVDGYSAAAGRIATSKSQTLARTGKLFSSPKSRPNLAHTHKSIKLLACVPLDGFQIKFT